MDKHIPWYYPIELSCGDFPRPKHGTNAILLLLLLLNQSEWVSISIHVVAGYQNRGEKRL